MTYENVLSEVENADEEAKKAKRLPRSYEESDKKLKTVKIVTNKDYVAKEENNKNKKPKPLATSNKQSATVAQEEEEEEEKKDIEETEEEPSVVQEETERVPLEEIQQPTMSVAEKLQAKGKKPGPYSKPAATYEKD